MKGGIMASMSREGAGLRVFWNGQEMDIRVFQIYDRGVTYEDLLLDLFDLPNHRTVEVELEDPADGTTFQIENLVTRLGDGVGDIRLVYARVVPVRHGDTQLWVRLKVTRGKQGGDIKFYTENPVKFND